MLANNQENKPPELTNTYLCKYKNKLFPTITNKTNNNIVFVDNRNSTIQGIERKLFFTLSSTKKKLIKLTGQNVRALTEQCKHIRKSRSPKGNIKTT